MRRAAAAAAAPAPAPSSNGSLSIDDGSTTVSSDKVKRRTSSTRRRNANRNHNQPQPPRRNGSSSSSKSPSSSSSSSCIFMSLVLIFVVADLIYLYKLSSQAFMSDSSSSSSSSAWKPTHLSRVAGIRYSTPRLSTNSHNNQTLTAAAAAHFEPHHNNLNNQLYQDALQKGFQNLNDKERILEILQQAGLTVDDLDQETINQLPTWTHIEQLYGTKPYVLGLERCETFVDATDPTVRFFGIAGTFNSGTNLVHELMNKNCQITERMMVYGNESKGIRWQVPWGKHYPASHRGMHDTKTDKVVPYTNSLPLVAIRDPYMWMQSQCRHHYTAFWPHTKEHCPNLVATESEIQHLPRLKNKYYETNVLGLGEKVDEPLIPVTVKYDQDVYEHESLAHFWSEWYRLYVDADYPRIMVRFEDMLFHAKEVIEELCKCGGGVPREDRPIGRDFVHISESAKLGTAAHGKHKTNLLGAIIRYGTFEHRLDSVTPADLAAAQKYFDPKILEIFGYHHPNPEDLSPS